MANGLWQLLSFCCFCYELAGVEEPYNIRRVACPLQADNSVYVDKVCHHKLAISMLFYTNNLVI